MEKADSNMRLDGVNKDLSKIILGFLKVILPISPRCPRSKGEYYLPLPRNDQVNPTPQRGYPGDSPFFVSRASI